MSQHQSWQQESGCLVPHTPWTGVASSMQHIQNAMTSTYQAKRRRASSVPGGYKSAIASNIEDHFDTARTYTSSPRDIQNSRDDATDRSTTANGSEEQLQAPQIPHWQRELARSRVGRHSRASSIISTRTRLTVQSEDARSVDFEAGGQSFRISRDGSSITNTTAPPPYPGPPLDQLAEESDEDDSLTRQSADTLREASPRIEAQDARALQSTAIRTHLPQTPDDTDVATEANRRASPFELPQRFRQVLNMSWYGSPTQNEDARASLNNQSANSLRRTQSDSSSIANFKPRKIGYQVNSENQNGDRTGSNGDDDALSLPQIARIPYLKASASGVETPDSSDERTAEVSAHYTRMIRTMDREHRQRLHERDTELGRLRELLNEKDIVYRQQLRDRDNVIEGLTQQLRHRDVMINEVKTRAYEMEEGMEKRIEKERNEVEDMWEQRWKEYDALVERVRRDGAAKVVMDSMKEDSDD